MVPVLASKPLRENLGMMADLNPWLWKGLPTRSDMPTRIHVLHGVSLKGSIEKLEVFHGPSPVQDLHIRLHKACLHLNMENSVNSR
jgi:hypothetical protein